MRFVRLTESVGGEAIYVNLDVVSTIEWAVDRSEIHFAGEGEQACESVRETPAEIFQLHHHDGTRPLRVSED